MSVLAGAQAGGLPGAGAAQGGVDFDVERRARGFGPWDVTESSFVSAYVVTIVGLLCALLAFQQFRKTWPSVFALSAQYTLFALLEGLTFGFGGIARHMLAAYYEEGIVMSRIWFQESSEWMFPWTISMLLGPLACATSLCVALAFVEAGIGWAWAAKIVGAVVAVVEVTMCFFNVDNSGALALWWAFVTNFLGLCVAIKGFNCYWCQPGAGPLSAGYVCRLVGCLVMISAPAGCWKPVTATEMYHEATVEWVCPYPFDFNQRAIFHVCIMASIALMYAGVVTKVQKEAQTALFQALPTQTNGSAPRRCCGSS